MHLNISGKRKNQQGENERCVVFVCVCVYVRIFPSHHFDLAVVMPPNVSVCIFIHIPTYLSGREAKEALVVTEKPQPLMEAKVQPFPVPVSWAGESNSRWQAR